MALAIFCHRNDIGFMGDHFGIKQKLCNDFFPTPSDTGICLTKNLDIKDILKPKEEYDGLFEPHLQKALMKIIGGTQWGGISLVLIPSQNQPDRKPEARGDQITIQLHQSKEFASMLKTKNYDDFLMPLTLENNHEYSIKVTPYGKKSMNGLQNLDIEKRKCKLDQEIEEESNFKLYTEKNCRYECVTKLAIDTCQCAPWDFMHRSSEEECDVFGRTCFYHAMEQLTGAHDDPCTHCIPGCNHMKYKKEIVEKKKMVPQMYDGDKDLGWGNDYLFCKMINDKPSCNGDEAFLNFFYDKNATFVDNGSYNIHDGISLKNTRYERAKMYKNVIIIHMKFMAPEIDLVDVKYTLMDKIANFGGNFGIFVEITGWSLLGFINLVLLMFKIVFITRN